MSSEEILEKVKAIIVEQLGVADTAVTLPANTLKAGKTYYVRFSYSKSGYITRCTIDPMK